MPGAVHGGLESQWSSLGAFWLGSRLAWEAKIKRFLAALTVVVLLASPAFGQATSDSKPDSSGSSASNPWSFSLTADGYVVPHSAFFISPTVTADREWLHLEARYNYENQQTGFHLGRL